MSGEIRRAVLENVGQGRTLDAFDPAIKSVVYTMRTGFQ